MKFYVFADNKIEYHSTDDLLYKREWGGKNYFLNYVLPLIYIHGELFPIKLNFCCMMDKRFSGGRGKFIAGQ